MRILKCLLLIFCFSIVILFYACDNNNECIRGSGNLANYLIDVTQFNKVALSGDINLQIKQGPDQKVTIATEPEIFAILEYGVKGTTFEVGYGKKVNCIQTAHGIWVNIEVPDINEIVISGRSEIFSIDDLVLDELSIIISGESKINITGQVNLQSIDVSGVVNVDNFGFVSDEVEITVSGSGDIEIYAQQLLNIIVSGAATVRYKGNPQISQQVSGILDLINAN